MLNNREDHYKYYAVRKIVPIELLRIRRQGLDIFYKRMDEMNDECNPHLRRTMPCWQTDMPHPPTEFDDYPPLRYAPPQDWLHDPHGLISDGSDDGPDDEGA